MIGLYTGGIIDDVKLKTPFSLGVFYYHFCYNLCKSNVRLLKSKLNILLLSSLVLTGLFFVKPQPVYAALIAHWKFDEGSGTTPGDSSGSNITGTFTSTRPTWSTDVPSVSFSDPYSLDFSGTGDAVYFSWPSSLNFVGTASRSFSFWYKPTGNGENASGNYDRIMSWTSDKFEIAGTLGDVAVHRLAFYDGSWRDTGYNLTPGTWYHITFTYDGTNVKLYVDNTVKFSGTSSGRDVNGTVYIGLRYTGDEGINGRIDDFRIYDTALTVSQISNLTAGSSNPDAAPDTTAPVISAVASTTNSTDASITWTTDEAGSSKVIYSADTNYASSTTETDTSSRVTSHTKSLTSLLACTSYNFKVISADAANNYATSTAASLTTTGCPGGASPTSATSTTITVSSSTSISSSDSGRTLAVTTPANFTATSSSVVIQIKGLTSSTVLDSINKPSNSLSSAASKVFDVTALINNSTVLDSFNSAVTISYTYTDADISGLNESSLKMYHYHNSAWSELDNCSVDTNANKITCTTPSFSIFAIFGTQTSSSSSNGGGGLPPAAYNPPLIPTNGFKVVFQKISGLNYDVKTNAGPDVKYIAISPTSDFKNISQLTYTQPLTWVACINNTCTKPPSIVYIKFYTAWGQQSSVITAQLNPDSETVKNTNQTCPYFTQYQVPGKKNAEVKKIKQFLNSLQNANLPVTEIYDSKLTKAIQQFQLNYSEQILKPWGFTKPTGRWYQSTMKTANDLFGCPASVKLDNGKILP
jgi:hypothetical protein